MLIASITALYGLHHKLLSASLSALVHFANWRPHSSIRDWKTFILVANEFKKGKHEHLDNVVKEEHKGMEVFYCERTYYSTLR